MRYLLFLFLSTVFSTAAFSQYRGDMLLTNIQIQLECTEAVDSLYNFRFDVAEKQFSWLKQQYPDHPLPYFLLGLSEWWKIMPFDAIEDYDEKFYAYMDSTIYFGELMYDDNPKNIEASFFLAAAYGFKARLQSDRGHYTKATFTAKKALFYLNESKELESDLSPEFLFGEGLYNYFREWIPDNKKYLKPIIMFFPKGDQEKGLAQLQKVASDAFYARVEAMTFQVLIYSEFENEKRKAYPIATNLYASYPNNAYFETYYSKLSFSLGKYLKAEKSSKSVLEKYKLGKNGYTVDNARKASFFLGAIYRSRRDTTKAIHYFEESIEYAKQANAYEKGYFWYSLEYLGELYVGQGDKEKAIYYYEQVVEYCPKKNETYKRAKSYLKKNKEKKGWFF